MSVSSPSFYNKNCPYVPQASLVPCCLVRNVVEAEVWDDMEVGPSHRNDWEGRAPFNMACLDL